jgi:hypothetical protein
MKRFEEQIAFQPAAQSQGFAPVQAPDVTGLLRQQNQSRLQEAKMFADQRMSDLKLEEQSLKYQELLENEEVGRLADFSDSLSKVLVEQAEARNEREEQRGLMLAYTYGMDPQAVVDFEEQEAALQQGTEVAYDEGGRLEANGLSVDGVKTVRGLTGWAKYGYMRGLAERGGAAYGTFFTQAATNLKVNVNGKEFTLAEAATGAERAAAKAAIAEAYMSQYQGMNPALLNKYLFPQMKNWEQQADLEWAESQRKAFEKEKLEVLKDDLYRHAKAGDGEGFMQTINMHKGSFGSRSAAIGHALDQLYDMVSNGLVTDEQLDRVLDHRIKRLDNGQMDSIRNIFERRIKLKDFEKAKRIAKQRELDLDQVDKKKAVADLKKLLQEEAKTETLDGGVPEEFIIRAQQRYNDIMDTTVEWDYLKENFKSDSVVDVEREVELAEQRMRQKGGTPYLTEFEFQSLSGKAQVALQRKYGKNLRVASAGNGIALTEDQSKALDRHLKAYTQTALKGLGLDGTGNYTEQGLFYKEQLEQKFNEYYQSSLAQTGNSAEAFEQARQLTKTYSTDVDEVTAAYKAQHTIKTTTEHKTNESIVKGWQTNGRQNLLTTKVQGLGSDERYVGGGTSPMQQLQTWRLNGGKDKLPSAFVALASQQRGVSAWDVAAAQYRLYNDGEELGIPLVEKNVRKLRPESKLLLVSHQSPGRTSRAALQEGGFSQFANLVGLHESEGYGGYDAMNTGGSGYGYNNRAVGSANSRDVFGRGLSEMTVGEVIQLGYEQKVFAAGRYQFIPETLRMVVQREGVPLNVKFDKNTQDFLFASQVRHRLAVHSAYGNVVQGLRTEWQGLYYASRQRIIDGVEAFKGSPFNNPEYLHPALLTTEEAR